MQTDPLERPALRRLVVVATVILVAAVFTGSVTSEVPDALPGIALGSPLLLHVERSLVLGAAVAGALIFLLRGWLGYFPSKLSTTGAEYAVRSAAHDAAQNEDDVSELIAGVESSRRELAASLRADLRKLERKLDTLVHPHRKPHDRQ